MWWFIAGATSVLAIQIIIACIKAPLIEDEEFVEKEKELRGNMSNYFKVVGTVVEKPSIKYHAFDIDFYNIELVVKKSSGKEESLACLVPSGFTKDIEVGQRIGVIGELRSRNGREDENQKVVVELFSNAVFYDVENMQDMNTASYSGRLVKKHFKYTKAGKPVYIGVLVRDRMDVDRPDAIPCVFFNELALDLCEQPIGTEINVNGKVVSRMVWNSTGNTWRVHEVYVSDYDIVGGD